MAHIIERSDSPFFWVSYTGPDGRRRRESLGIRMDATDGRRRAMRKLADIEAQEQANKAESGHGCFAAWVSGWISIQYSNPHTRSRYLAAWAALSVFLADRKASHPGDVTYALARDYMVWRTNPPESAGLRPRNWNTALTELRFLGAVMQEAVRRGLVQANPCARLGLGRRAVKEKGEIDHKTETGIRAALDAAGTPEWMRDAFSVAMAQGCRLAECAVPMADIDRARGVIAFRCKGGRIRAAALNPDLKPLVERRSEAGCASLVDVPANAGKLWHQWFKARGWGHLSFHCTRVTVVTRMARAGVPIAQAMDFVGHASEVVHAVYRKLQPADMSAALAALRRPAP